MLDVVKLESNRGNSRCLADVRNEEGWASLSDGAIGGISIEVGEDVATDVSSCFMLCSNIDVVDVDGRGGASGGLRRSSCSSNFKGVWRGASGSRVINGTLQGISSDTVGSFLGLQFNGSAITIRVDGAGVGGKILGTSLRGQH